MSKYLHAIEVRDGSSLARQDALTVAHLPGVANVVGGGAGAAVVTAVAIPNLPAKYSVLVNPGQDATWFVSGKTANGFNVTLNPRLAANTLAAGTFDVTVIA
ncbi:hypothetical protein RA280_15330 [Cupriavidus sp. CV2]|uniref:hypothetical protein n=1 Tax=Cupriavidus ulmosensis TaxID=3065913 RepID=UPI00296A9369|nr:hypothetical protein [Cupriavidus sp. CV2]MDW3683097.1 hypothetical protein [Cupriavidus sp. CV2]